MFYEILICVKNQDFNFWHVKIRPAVRGWPLSKVFFGGGTKQIFPPNGLTRPCLESKIWSKNWFRKEFLLHPPHHLLTSWKCSLPNANGHGAYCCRLSWSIIIQSSYNTRFVRFEWYTAAGATSFWRFWVNRFGKDHCSYNHCSVETGIVAVIDSIISC